MFLEKTDPQIQSALQDELTRQRSKLEMIASENFTSLAVMEAQGSTLTNKYAEGLPGKRYYGGCEYVDVAEQLAIDRVKQLFGAAHANVQPHSGAQANMAAYLAFLKPGDTILGLSLAHGGHLTHGSHVNLSGIYFHVVPYGVDPKTETIDYDALAALAKEHHPKLIVGGGSAYARVIDFAKMAEIAKSCGALLMIDMAHIAGLIAAGVHPSPVPHADIVTSTTHKTLRGPRGGFILCGEVHAKAIDKAVFPGIQGGPLMHVIAAKAVAFQEALQPSFRAYQEQVVKNAKRLAQVLTEKGLRIVSGGTDTHLMLVDLRPVSLTGKVAEQALDAVGITANKNAIPFDPEKPFMTSGIRLGTPALTTRGMKEPEMTQIGALIHRTLTHLTDEAHQQAVKAEVAQLCRAFPLYPELDRVPAA